MLSQIDIYRFRNISEAHLHLEKNNLLVGMNGSGKTSVLEALHLLAYGKSFRGTSIDSVIQYNHKDLVVSSRFDDKKAGVQRFRNGGFSIRLNGQDVPKVSELSRMFPTHVIEPNSVQLVEGSPGERRRYLDFTMFHVEHSYLEKHKRFTDALKQRNALLKDPSHPKNSQLSYWDEIYASASWELHSVRKRLFEEVISPNIRKSLALLMEDTAVDVGYEAGCRGAESEADFIRRLADSRDQELRFKATQFGPHRADISLKHKEKLAKDYLSRGQKKLLTYGVRLAPALMLKDLDKQIGQILIDDMPSELDEVSVAKVCELVKMINSQVVLTAVDETNRQVEIIKEQLTPKVFHVEHGTLSG